MIESILKVCIKFFAFISQKSKTSWHFTDVI